MDENITTGTGNEQKPEGVGLRLHDEADGVAEILNGSEGVQGSGVVASCVCDAFPKNGATDALFVFNRFLVDSLRFAVADLDAMARQRPRNSTEGVALAYRAQAVRNSLARVLDELNAIEQTVGGVVVADLQARLARAGRDR